MAFSGGMPSLRSESNAKSIIMTPFLFTIPISRTMPISEITLKSAPVTLRASNAPTPAEGSVDKMVMGWM